MPKNGKNSLKKKARQLAAYEGIPYSAALASLHESDVTMSTDRPALSAGLTLGDMQKILAQAMQPKLDMQKILAQAMQPKLDMQKILAQAMQPKLDMQK
ncbi:hypothetical protein ABT237_15640, partial [Streptomyces sp. NPDC001581]|uniref:hypothetical protein n=1 Tax=Streptomyces sp. NPDC001581 TaxID=3154386 RepID=UPI00331CDFC8